MSSCADPSPRCSSLLLASSYACRHTRESARASPLTRVQHDNPCKREYANRRVFAADRKCEIFAPSESIEHGERERERESKSTRHRRRGDGQSRSLAREKSRVADSQNRGIITSATDNVSRTQYRPVGYIDGRAEERSRIDRVSKRIFLNIPSSFRSPRRRREIKGEGEIETRWSSVDERVRRRASRFGYRVSSAVSRHLHAVSPFDRPFRHRTADPSKIRSDDSLLGESGLPLVITSLMDAMAPRTSSRARR